MAKIKLCGVCGKEFEVKAKNQRYCGVDCKASARKMVMDKYTTKVRQEKEERENLKNSSLTEIDKRAKELGLSYGKLTSMTEMGDRSYC